MCEFIVTYIVYVMLCLLVKYDQNPSQIKKWAYSFDELIEKLDKTLAASPAANQPYIFITHVRDEIKIEQTRHGDSKQLTSVVLSSSSTRVFLPSIISSLSHYPEVF